MATAEIEITTKPCMVCHESATIYLTPEENEALESGAYVQKALPNRSDDFRELLISGTHAHCWESLFGDMDDEEEWEEK